MRTTTLNRFLKKQKMGGEREKRKETNTFSTFY